MSHRVRGVQKNCDGKIPSPGGAGLTAEDRALLDGAAAALGAARACVQEQDMKGMCEVVISVAKVCVYVWVCACVCVCVCVCEVVVSVAKVCVMGARASPCLALPRLALPRLASPRLASPCLALSVLGSAEAGLRAHKRGGGEGGRRGGGG